MKRIICIIIIILVGVCVVNAETVTIGSPDDVIVDWNKSGTQIDDRMCWAYALINVIQYSYGSDNQSSKHLFRALHKQFGNTDQSIPEVWAWIWYTHWADDELDTTKIAELFHWVYDYAAHTGSPNIVMWIKGALLQNEVVLIGTYSDKEAHVVTCYAYRYTNGKRQLAIADSDDEDDGAFWTTVTNKHGKWYLEDFNDMYINAAYSFKLLPRD